MRLSAKTAGRIKKRRCRGKEKDMELEILVLPTPNPNPNPNPKPDPGGVRMCDEAGGGGCGVLCDDWAPCTMIGS